MRLVKLKPSKNSKYHFGETGLDDSSLYFMSSSLFSAVVNNFVKMYGEKDIESLTELKISSLYPAVDEEFFIPKPHIFFLPKETFREEPKLSKRVKFVSLNYIKDIFEGKKPKFSKEQIVDGLLFSFDGFEKLDKEDRKGLFKTDYEVKVMLGRPYDNADFGENETGPYAIFYVYPVSSKFFYYFIYDDSKLTEDVKRKVEASIRLICDEGLGGERGTGAGGFESIEFVDEENHISSFVDFVNNLGGVATKKWMSLSLVIPKNKEEFLKAEEYTLIKRAGYIYQKDYLHYKKKQIYVISDGSTFSEEIEGKVVDVSPVSSMRVFLNGRFLGIPILEVSYDWMWNYNINSFNYRK